MQVRLRGLGVFSQLLFKTKLNEIKLTQSWSLTNENIKFSNISTRVINGRNTVSHFIFANYFLPQQSVLPMTRTKRNYPPPLRKQAYTTVPPGLSSSSSQVFSKAWSLMTKFALIRRESRLCCRLSFSTAPDLKSWRRSSWNLETTQITSKYWSKYTKVIIGSWTIMILVCKAVLDK